MSIDKLVPAFSSGPSHGVSNSIRRIPTGWQIVITADGETVIASVGNRQLGWEVFKVALFARHNVWLCGHDPASWRRAVIACLNADRQGARHEDRIPNRQAGRLQDRARA